MDLKRIRNAVAALVSAIALFATAWVGTTDFAPQHLVPRSGRWQTVRRHHLAKHPDCAACGTRDDVEVHHIQPFHLKPELELDPTNLITLCRYHHQRLGHPGGWKNSNPNVVTDAENVRNAPADAERVSNKLNPQTQKGR